MPQPRLTLSEILDRLDKFYGPQMPSFPVDPYEFLVWWYCGYPASDAACSRGWNSLIRDVGVDPGKLLKAKPAKLALAIKPGGMLPELRAQRLQELAFRVENEFGGDLRAALVGPVPKARKLLKSFHGIADPGADRILLFAGILPIAAVPSNCAGVLLRILKNAMGEGRLSGQRCPLTPLSLFLSGGGRAVTAGFRTTLRIWRTVLLRVSESLRTGISRGFPNDGIRACALIIQMPNFAQLHESLF